MTKLIHTHGGDPIYMGESETQSPGSPTTPWGSPPGGTRPGSHRKNRSSPSGSEIDRSVLSLARLPGGRLCTRSPTWGVSDLSDRAKETAQLRPEPPSCPPAMGWGHREASWSSSPGRRLPKDPGPAQPGALRPAPTSHYWTPVCPAHRALPAREMARRTRRPIPRASGQGREEPGRPWTVESGKLTTFKQAQTRWAMPSQRMNTGVTCPHQGHWTANSFPVPGHAGQMGASEDTNHSVTPAREH